MKYLVVAVCLVPMLALADAQHERFAGERTISAADKATLIAWRKYFYPWSGLKEAEHPANGIEDNDVRIMDSDFQVQQDLIDERLKPTGDRSFSYWLKNYCGADHPPEIHLDLAVVKFWRLGDAYPDHSRANPMEFMYGALPQCPTPISDGPDGEQKRNMALWKKIKVLHYVLPTKPVQGKPFFIDSTDTNLELSWNDKTGELTIAYNPNTVNLGDQGIRWYRSHL